jgi:hypothetical protein
MSRTPTIDEEVAAAYALDRVGREAEAVVHYDAAYRMGGPSSDRGGFLLGYGSTLRNVGRLEDSLEVLTAATAELPDDQALRCFLALTLHGLGRHAEAMATMLEVALALRDGSPSISRYSRALGEYRAELVAPSDRAV